MMKGKRESIQEVRAALLEERPSVSCERKGERDTETHPQMVFKVAGEHARELREWSKRSFESRKPFGEAKPRF